MREPDSCATGGPATGLDIEVDDGVDLEDLLALLTDELEDIIAQTLDQRSPRPAREFAARVIGTDLAMADPGSGPHDAGALGQSASLLVLATFLAAARESAAGAAPDETALAWVSREMGPSYADTARRAAALATTSDGLDSPCDISELGADFLPGLVWLATGLAAESGDHDTRFR